ncbi:MAG: HRDC domain-containing protein [Kofleriaceae bacterium]
MQLITDPAEAERVARSLAAAEVVGFDCEFLSQDRLVPKLCLLQLVYEEASAQQIAVVDCLALDVAGLVAALAQHPCPVAHAPRQDLQLLATRFGADLPQVFDLQTAAAFVGLGDQVGYARLVGAVLGVELAKDLQWTDWARRPLTDAQLAYAAADVGYLLPLYRELQARLGPRLAWARDESQRLARLATDAAALREEDAWEDVAGSGALPPRAIGAVVALAAWRLGTARRLDRPLGHVLPDKALVELARRPPRDGDALRRRVESPIAREHADEVLTALRGAESRDAPAPSAAKPRRGPLSTRAEAWVAGLLLIVELVAEREQIAPRLLATRAEVEALARSFERDGASGLEGHAAMQGWRRPVLGALCHGWLHGELAIVAGPDDARAAERSPVRLVPRGA